MYNLIQQDKNTTLHHLPKGKNMTNFSILNEFSEKLAFRAFSIKYVIEGYEKYQVNGTNYHVRTGEYLLANTFCEGRVEIESRQLVKGVCIDIAPDLLSEVFSHFARPDTPMPDIQLDTFFNTEEFLENKYQTKHTHLGAVLSEIGQIFSTNPFYAYHISDEFYFTLAENIVADHQNTISQLYNIHTVKHHTRKDLYRKITLGKEFLENNLHNPIQIKEVAKVVGLSEYHFFRLFKTTFGTTPQQYFLRKRLQEAYNLLKTGNYNITEVATEMGFADIYSFSKAFKKRFTISPINVIER